MMFNKPLKISLMLFVWLHILTANGNGQALSSKSVPFNVEKIAQFTYPWGLAFLPDGRILVGEKHSGKIFLVTQAGQKSPIKNVPKVAGQGQNGLLDIALAPDFTHSSQIYFSLVEPSSAGTRLILMRAQLIITQQGAKLEKITTLWQQSPAGGRGQPGGVIAFDAKGQHLYLSVGDRMQPMSAQDPDNARGKVVRLHLDGSTSADNPQSAQGGVRGQTWTSGHRNPYGLAFAPDGSLWSHEMGPRGGDEFNLIERGNNYGWPIVSNGNNYNFTTIPDHATRPEFRAPLISWTPVISPAGLIFYDGGMFAGWQGLALMGGLSSQALIAVRITRDTQTGGVQAQEVARWHMGARIRNVAQAPDGALWLVEDQLQGGLLRLTPAL